MDDHPRLLSLFRGQVSSAVSNVECARVARGQLVHYWRGDAIIADHNGLGGEKPLWRHTATLLRRYLRERRDVGPYLFTGRKGPLQKRQVQQLFTDYSKAAGIKARSVHALRHSMAVHLLEAGRGIEYVADHLGHKNIQNTRIYAQITHPLREQVFRELEQHPKIVRFS